MSGTTLEGFREFLESVRHVCESSWNKELREEYKQICEEVGMK